MIQIFLIDFFCKTDTDTLLLFSTYAFYNDERTILYYAEQYKQNKKLVPAKYQYEFRIIDGKIINTSSDVNNLSFNTKEELEKQYGK